MLNDERKLLLKTAKYNGERYFYIFGLSEVIFNIIAIFLSQASPDRLTFYAEWNDTLSSVIWKFNLFFYPSDETIELASIKYSIFMSRQIFLYAFNVKNRLQFDLVKHRLFLKRTKCGNITLDDLYIGATLRICSRLITIEDYGDPYTRSKIGGVAQKFAPYSIHILYFTTIFFTLST